VAKSKKKTKPAKGKKAARKTRVKSKPRAGKKISVKTKPRAARKISVKTKPRAKSKPVKPARKPMAKAKPPARKRIIGGLPGQLYEAAMRVLNERQAEEIVTVDLEGRSTMADYLIVASGRAQRQIAAIADYLREAFMKLGVKQVRIEGLPEANWVLVDAGDIVVHLFRPEVRKYYHLEDIWNRKAAR
jgi:ribosome-associated protein